MLNPLVASCGNTDSLKLLAKTKAAKAPDTIQMKGADKIFWNKLYQDHFGYSKGTRTKQENNKARLSCSHFVQEVFNQ